MSTVVGVDVKEQLKRIKKLNSSVLMAQPSIPDVNSDIISKIGVLYGTSGDSAKQ